MKKDVKGQIQKFVHAVNKGELGKAKEHMESALKIKIEDNIKKAIKESSL